MYIFVFWPFLTSGMEPQASGYAETSLSLPKNTDNSGASQHQVHLVKYHEHCMSLHDSFLKVSLAFYKMPERLAKSVSGFKSMTKYQFATKQNIIQGSCRYQFPILIIT